MSRKKAHVILEALYRGVCVKAGCYPITLDEDNLRLTVWNLEGRIRSLDYLHVDFFWVVAHVTDEELDRLLGELLALEGQEDASVQADMDLI